MDNRKEQLIDEIMEIDDKKNFFFARGKRKDLEKMTIYELERKKTTIQMELDHLKKDIENKYK